MIYASTEKVVVAWLASLPGLNASMIGPQLSSDNTTWAASGFITPFALGGYRGIHVPVSHPMVGLKCWAVNPDTGVPPWNMAANLAEIVANGCFQDGYSQFLTLPYCDQNARLLSAYMVDEPRRAYGDIGDYACFDTTVALHWAAR